MRISIPKPATGPALERLAVSRKEAAVMLSVCERTLDNLVKRGELKSRKVGSRVVYPLDSLRSFLHGRDDEQEAE